MARRLCFSLLVALLPLLAAAAHDPLLQEGIALLNAGKVEAALVALHDAARRLPDPTLANRPLGEGYLRLGMHRLETGDEAAAREAFAEARRYLPDDFRPHQGLALAWLHESQPVPAISELQEALAVGGERPELLALLGRAHYAAGELIQAEEAWQRAVELGAGGEVAGLLDKVRRERRAETAMRRDLAGRFTIAYAPGVSDALAARVLEVLQDAYAAIGADLGVYPEVDIPVLLYAREDFAAVTRSPEWAGAVYDGKIRVPLGGVRQMTPPLRSLLHHEYTHVAVRFLAKGRAPVWLNEGLAELNGRRQHPAPPAHAAAGGKVLPPGALERSFGALPAEAVPLAYQRSYERVRRLVELCGWPPLGELLERLGRGEEWPAAVAAAYAPYGYDWPRLQVELGDELH